MSEFRDNLSRLRDATVEFVREREAAEARVAEVNPVIQQLGTAGLASKGHQITGPIVECWNHPEVDSATYNAAAIQVPDGVGVVRFELAFGDEPDEETSGHFIPFMECETSLQAKLRPHIDSLVAELVRALNISSHNS